MRLRYLLSLWIIVSLVMITSCKFDESSSSDSSDDAITAFSFEAANNSALSTDVTGTIDQDNNTIAVTVPTSTTVTALVATFTTSGTSVTVDGTEQSSGTTANDFSDSVTYTVTADDGTTRDYTVTVTVASTSDKSITAFSFKAANNSALSTDVTGTIDQDNNTIAVTIPSITTVTALVASFTTSGTSVTVDGTEQSSGTTANDFSNSVTYTVTAGDGTTQDYVVSTTKDELAQQAYIKAVNNDSDDRFGYSVSLSGDTLAVGAYYEDSDQTTITNGTTASLDDDSSSSGAVYIYQRSGTDWSQQAYIKAVNNDSSDYFGSSVSLSDDTLAVGAYYEDSDQATITNGTTASGTDSGHDSSGAVYVYQRSGTNWSQQAYIKAMNNDANDNFGYSVSLSGDTLAVGAYYEDSDQTTITNGTTAGGTDSGHNDSGAVYVYQRSGTNWSQQAYIKAVNNDALDYFGSSVSLSGDTLAVGAFYESSDQTTITNGTTASSDNDSGKSGAVYVYQRSGTEWSQQAYIKAVNNGSFDWFGSSVSLSGDTLAVGAYLEDSDQTTITNGTTAGGTDNTSYDEIGAVYVYQRNGTEWSQQAYIKAVNNGSDDYFGSSVSLSGDTLAVGAYRESSDQATITNGTTASSDDTSFESGAVYLYHRNGTDWSQQAYIKAVNNGSTDWFGSSVSLSGNTLAVGAYYEDSDQTTITNGTTAGGTDSGHNDSGAVYVYH